MNVRRAFIFLLVIFLIAIGLSIFMPLCACGSSERGQLPATQADIKGGFKSALSQYKVDNGSYPGSLLDLVQKPNGATNWHGPYLENPRLPVDPWGDPYIYHFPGTHNAGSYDLLSVGPDGKEGTADDIVNW